MDEFSFIRSVQPAYYKQSSLIKGISDDAAVIRPSGGDVVTAVDTMVEDVHFSRKTMQPHHIGHRVLAANLSDLAAMGSTPAYYMVSITIPSDWSEEELIELYAGMDDLAARYRMDLIGGDTVSGRELSVTVTVMGTVAKGKARYRSAAVPGDVLFVTGTLGDSRGGLEWLLNEKNDSSSDQAFLIDRHRKPWPRVSFAEGLSTLQRVALNDVSDGIANEANEIAESSGVDIHIAKDMVPFSSALKNTFPDQYQDWMLSGGEDFELLGAVPLSDWTLVQENAEIAGIKITKIGEVDEVSGDSPRVFIKESDQIAILKKSGYTHLKGKG
ncbi:thiamine-phosphate kinase [Halobacillus litoralis]|uniref:thiamine-phosphate kinase n=1 Tax=Halobacillus litoralis TaxID=45668 RepID=UPI00248FEA24|nr:thiamine-phosphate kinase [Halobacillus litoralis]